MYNIENIIAFTLLENLTRIYYLSFIETQAEKTSFSVFAPFPPLAL